MRRADLARQLAFAAIAEGMGCALGGGDSLDLLAGGLSGLYVRDQLVALVRHIDGVGVVVAVLDYVSEFPLVHAAALRVRDDGISGSMRLRCPHEDRRRAHALVGAAAA